MAHHHHQRLVIKTKLGYFIRALKEINGPYVFQEGKEISFTDNPMLATRFSYWTHLTKSLLYNEGIPEELWSTITIEIITIGQDAN